MLTSCVLYIRCSSYYCSGNCLGGSYYRLSCVSSKQLSERSLYCHKVCVVTGCSCCDMTLSCDKTEIYVATLC
jgi:hypothetical protein